ncbi:hypothetical protein ECC02_009064 [Trypanosoma cruzi]|uniref:Uncharacterized protein n=1 Tax=Trypanosoma cruzi TaxID=5693 RepID=A0A7J6XVK3_TRYCR|nr:hypothetical protein ECC02_009064 [Trypanosoma cruzi]
MQHNGCPQYSLEECRRILRELMRDGLPVMWHEASNRRLAHSSSIPYNAPIGCELHGHMQTVHIFVESQHAHWGFLESPQYCESFFLNVPLPESETTLAKLVVLFQGQGSLIFGSRVRYFTLPAVCSGASPTAFLTHFFHRKAELAPNTVYLRTQLCSLTCHILHAYFRGYASFIWTPTTPSYHPMRHPCTVVVVVTVILFFPRRE